MNNINQIAKELLAAIIVNDPERTLARFSIILDKSMIGSTKSVVAEMERAMKKHNDFPSVHHGFGVITEEYFELVEAVRSDDLNEIKKEATQLAAMGLRLLCFLEKREHERKTQMQEVRQADSSPDEAHPQQPKVGDRGSVLHQMREGIQVRTINGLTRWVKFSGPDEILLVDDPREATSYPAGEGPVHLIGVVFQLCYGVEQCKYERLS